MDDSGIFVEMKPDSRPWNQKLSFCSSEIISKSHFDVEHISEIGGDIEEGHYLETWKYICHESGVLLCWTLSMFLLHGSLMVNMMMTTMMTQL